MSLVSEWLYSLKTSSFISLSFARKNTGSLEQRPRNALLRDISHRVPALNFDRRSIA